MGDWTPKRNGNWTVKAIKDIRRYLNDHPDTPSASVLERLPETVSKEDTLALRDLYALDWESFELALELLRDWRIDRYYADRIDLVGAARAKPRTNQEQREGAE